MRLQVIDINDASEDNHSTVREKDAQEIQTDTGRPL